MGVRASILNEVMVKYAGDQCKGGFTIIICLGDEHSAFACVALQPEGGSAYK